jgi:molybdopterin converting factor subunit 1
MQITVLFFAASREATGTAQQQVELPEGATTHTLWEHLLAAHPPLAAIKASCVLAVNQQYVQPSEAQPLAPRDEVAIIPPLSGG